MSGTTLQRLAGLPFPNAPDWRVTLSPRVEGDVAASAKAFAQVDFRYQSAITFDISNDPRLGQGAYSIFDASLGVTFDSGLELSAFVRNLFGRQYADGKINFNSGFIGASYAQLIPRDFHRHGGVTLRYKF